MEIGSEEWGALIREGARAFGLVLSAEHTDRMARHAEQLQRWNRVTNLTRVTEPADVARRHFLDSLAAAAYVPPAAALLDIGSGGGFPGLPLHLVCSGLHTTLIDASRKKVSFLRQVIRELRLTGIEALHARAQELADRGGKPPAFDVVASRALGDPASFLRMALPLLAAGGRILAWRGRMGLEEVQALARAARNGDFGLALRLRRCDYRIPGLAAERSLLVIERLDPRRGLPAGATPVTIRSATLAFSP
jgi:16S rRNA (guanine527-N7)-methyltransferase